ncbi:MAG: hypothetical protein GF355_11265 [Candidatus Eisenbacteria bacterium]|nr:hypothetical protein [Candidatus Eisenbacteria bacterium]
MSFVVTGLLAGFLGTAVMTLFLWSVDRFTPITADMVRALGSGVTRRMEGSFLPGLSLHVAGGLIFAFLYIFGLQAFRIGSLHQAVATGLLFGVVHGFAFAFVMLILAEYHPVETYKRAGFAVAVVHLTAHAVFGLVVGLIVGLSGRL